MNLIKETSAKIKVALFHPENKKALLPNWISFTRIIGGVAIPILANQNAKLSTLVKTTTIVALSDFLDGKIARFLNAESDDGALLDAISDKIFSLSLIIGLIPKNKIFIINGILETTIALINAKSLANGGKPKSNLLGKIKTWPLSFSLALAYISLSLNSTFLNLSNDELMHLSTSLSEISIPLELINIKEYLDASKSEKKLVRKKDK